MARVSRRGIGTARVAIHRERRAAAPWMATARKRTPRAMAIAAPAASKSEKLARSERRLRHGDTAGAASAEVTCTCGCSSSSRSMRTGRNAGASAGADA